jgi:excisionase family DNA binding protein
MTSRSVSLDEAASFLGCSRRTIYNRIHEGKLHTLHVGGSQRVWRWSLEGRPGPEEDVPLPFEPPGDHQRSRP